MVASGSRLNPHTNGIAMASIRPTAGTRTAFTVIELLTVVSIFTVLVGILLPDVTLVKIAARKSTCASPLRHLAMGASP